MPLSRTRFPPSSSATGGAAPSVVAVEPEAQLDVKRHPIAAVGGLMAQIAPQLRLDPAQDRGADLGRLADGESSCVRGVVLDLLAEQQPPRAAASAV